MNYLGVGISPGNVPVYHATNLKVIDRRVRFAELVLRCLICGFSLLAALLIGTDSQVKEIFTIRKNARFTDMKALVFLVVANGVSATYSFIQVVRCVVGMVRGSVLVHKPLAWAIFTGDQVPYFSLWLFALLAYLVGETMLKWPILRALTKSGEIN